MLYNLSRDQVRLILRKPVRKSAGKYVGLHVPLRVFHERPRRLRGALNSQPRLALAMCWKTGNRLLMHRIDQLSTGILSYPGTVPNSVETAPGPATGAVIWQSTMEITELLQRVHHGDQEALHTVI